MTFSLCMIVKNEEKTLERCLESVKGVFDEIIIVDTGSFDKTKLIASEFTDKIYDYAWNENFSDARNYSFSKAKGDYIMWLDADDVVDGAEREKLVYLKETASGKTDVYMMKYAAAFDANGKETFTYYRERLLKRERNFKWKGFVHEVITPSGNVEFCDITVKHLPPEDESKDPARNLRMYENYISKGGILDARQKYYYARELYYNGRKDKAAAVFEDFLRDKNAWPPDKLGAVYTLYDIYEKDNPEKAGDALAKGLTGECLAPQLFCLAGDRMLARGRLPEAVLWYKTALLCPEDYRKYGFATVDYEEYYPYMQLCLCYDRLGDIVAANKYNQKAKNIKPDSEEVKYNEKYFENILKDGKLSENGVENESEM
ncbi:MAG: glycosyltransferase family 2 protein [Clostridia bacterium]|nr:glycosyltransferase family 2 protein [Clostridia bacterium]